MAPSNAASTSPIKSSAGRPNPIRSARAHSRGITPIIKIVHVYAPMLFRTDVANFRALVQEKTGNAHLATASDRNSAEKNVIADCLLTQASATNQGTAKPGKLLQEAKTRHGPCVSAEARAYADQEKTPVQVEEKGVEDEGDGSWNGSDVEVWESSRSEWMISEEGNDQAPGQNYVQSSPCMYGESSWDHSIESFFVESEDCNASLAAHWTSRQASQLPGGFESFNCF